MVIMGEARFHNLLGCWILISSLHLGLCQAQTSKPAFQQPATNQNQPIGAILGLARAGNSPIPGAKLDLPLSSLVPGFYTAQVNVIDDSAGSFLFPRFALLIRPEKSAEAR